MKSVHFREVLQLDARKYDTLLEVVKRTIMVWTCGDRERKPGNYHQVQAG